MLEIAYHTPNLFGSFRKLSEAFRKFLIFRKFFGRFRTFRKLPEVRNAFWNEEKRTTSLLEHSTNNHDRKKICIVYYIQNGSEINASDKKSSKFSGNLGSYHGITEKNRRLPKLPKFRKKRQVCLN